MNVSQQISELIDKHMSTLRDNGRQVIDAMSASPPDLVSAQSVAHMIKGAAGSIGFAEYSESALHLEKHLKAIIASDGIADEHSFQLLEKFKDVHANLKPTDSSLYSA